MSELNGNAGSSQSKCSQGVPEVSNFREALPQFLVVGVKNLILLGWGFILGFPTILIPALIAPNNSNSTTTDGLYLTNTEISWIGSINLLCVPIGSLLSGILVEPLGKRRVMQILNIPMLFAWALLYFSTNIITIYAALGLAGLSGGLLEAPLLTYIAETVQPRFRGMLTATGTATVIGGVCVQFIVGSFIEWRTVAALSAIIPFLAFNAVFFVPESPVWLYSRNRVEEAHESLQWLRGWVPFSLVEKEFEQIIDSSERTKADKLAIARQQVGCTGRIVPYTRRSFIAPFILIVSAFFIGHFSGMTPLQTYAIQIFSAFKAPINKYYATIMLGTAQLIGCILGSVFIRSTGKRPLVFASLIGCGLCFFATASYAHFSSLTTDSNISGNGSISHVSLDEYDLNTDQLFAVGQTIDDEDDLYRWLPLVLLLGGSMCAHMGVKLIPWMLIGEVYPSTVRGTAAGISSALGYLVGFLANKVFLNMVALLTLNGVFWFYSAVAIFGCVILFFVLPETENKSLSEIEAFFDKKNKQHLREKSTLNKERTMTEVTMVA